MVWLASGLAWFTRYFIQHENRASHEPPRPAELWLLLNKKRTFVSLIFQLDFVVSLEPDISNSGWA